MGGWGEASGSSLLELLESESGSFGGGVVGNGCCVAASDGVVDGAGVSGVVGDGVAGLAGSPGNGNCSAVDLGWAGVGGVQGLAV